MDLLDDEGPLPGAGNVPEFTVSELSGAIKRTLEGEFGRVRVRGEVGRVVQAKSGHLYYDIKDARNVISCNTWKGQVSGLGVRPEEGMEVVVTGRLSAYGAQSRYNMNVDAMEIAGAGALMAMLEKRRVQLAGEGLFDGARKVALPFLPQVIGVVTSPSGAVIRDILHRLRDRFPRHVLVWPVAVQGKACAPEVSRAIAGFNALPVGGAIPRPDLIIVARGGGSLEDLWGFNEEAVVRAAAASVIPLISAVGHETDTTLIDYAADQRAPTPTAAAEMAVPVRLDLLGALRSYGARMDAGLRGGLRGRAQRLADVARALPRGEMLLAPYRQRIDIAAERLPVAMDRGLARRRLELGRLEGRLGKEALRARLSAEQRRLAGLAGRLEAAPAQNLLRTRRSLLQLSARLTPKGLERQIARDRDRLLQRAGRIERLASGWVSVQKQKVETLGRLLQSLGYRATLARGYVVVRNDNGVVTQAKEARAAVALELEFADGKVALRGGPSKKPPKSADPEDQGSLF